MDGVGALSGRPRTKLHSLRIKIIWCFNRLSQFPGGLFDELEKARASIALHRLSGVLTAYPLNSGVFDWAVEQGHLTDALEAAADRGAPDFV